jgi:hypothetical protein
MERNDAYKHERLLAGAMIGGCVLGLAGISLAIAYDEGHPKNNIQNPYRLQWGLNRSSSPSERKEIDNSELMMLLLCL